MALSDDMKKKIKEFGDKAGLEAPEAFMAEDIIAEQAAAPSEPVELEAMVMELKQMPGFDPMAVIRMLISEPEASSDPVVPPTDVAPVA